ncbi:MAG: Wzt carbohydrate-binding domain-containing protein, partial [Candidatus Riflebacteria bacterium]|nr:Wzt carbohydrate-binding domain-containing protein [Candidatus Riflebacteria bacterium]
LLLENGRKALLGTTDQVIRAYLEDSERQARRITDGDRLLHASRVPEERLGKVRILGVDFLDAAGNPTSEFASGGPLRMRIRFVAEEEVVEPLFRVQFFRNDGLWVMGSNTARGGLELGSVKGEGAVSLALDSLNLLDGDYYVSVGAWPDEYPSYLARMPYDLHDRRYVLQVRSGRPEGAGIVYCPARWERG